MTYILHCREEEDKLEVDVCVTYAYDKEVCVLVLWSRGE